MNTKTATAEAISFIKELIASRSLSGEEDDVANLIQKHLETSGFTVETDDYGNVIGQIKGNRPGATFLFDGHMDTVPVPDPTLWHTDPFSPIVKDNRLYGRGTSDMKSAIGTFLTAADAFLSEHGTDFSGTLAFSGIVMEECFEGIAARNVSRIVKPDLVMIGEASDCNVKISQRGRAEIRLEVFGKPAHSSNPDKGINAVYKISDLISEIRNIKPPVHPFMGKGILELTDIKSIPYPGASVVPEYCFATYDRRLLVNETEESVLAPLKSLLEEKMKQDPDLTAKVSYSKGDALCRTGKRISSTRFFPGWMGDPNAPFVIDVMASLKGSGLSPSLTRYDFCTNGSHYAGEAGIPCFGFGPSSETLAHTVDEYVTLEQIRDAVIGYHAILEKLML